MSSYELMYVVKPELDEDGVQREIDRVNQLIQTNGGQVKKVTPWGKRRLAYAVKDLHEGHYVVAEFDLERCPTRDRRCVRIRLLRSGRRNQRLQL